MELVQEQRQKISSRRKTILKIRRNDWLPHGDFFLSECRWQVWPLSVLPSIKNIWNIVEVSQRRSHQLRAGPIIPATNAKFSVLSKTVPAALRHALHILYNGLRCFPISMRFRGTQKHVIKFTPIIKLRYSLSRFSWDASIFKAIMCRNLCQVSYTGDSICEIWTYIHLRTKMKHYFHHNDFHELRKS